MITLPAVKNKTFVGKTLWLDFSHFKNCTLIDCKLVFFGFGGMIWDGNSFQGCTFVTRGPARQTISFVRDSWELGIPWEKVLKK